MFSGIAKSIIILVFLLLPNVVFSSTLSSDLIEKGEELYVNYDKDLKNLEKAIAYYYKAIEENDALSYEAYWRIATIYWTLGEITKDDDKKIGYFTIGQDTALKGIELNEGRAEAHYWYFACLGKLMGLKGKMSAMFSLVKLKKHINKALQIDPDFTYAINGKAILLKKLPSYMGGDMVEAEKMLKRSAELDPNLSATYICLAELYIKDGKNELAKSYINKVVNLKNPRWNANWRHIFLPKAQDLLDKINQEQSLWSYF